mgnify:CR=1 FL=1
MEIINYLVEESIVLVPVIWIIGTFLKKTPRVPDWIIPWVLLVVSIVISIIKLGFNIQSVIQGILVTGAAVLGHQLVKQTARRS